MICSSPRVSKNLIGIGYAAAAAADDDDDDEAVDELER